MAAAEQKKSYHVSKNFKGLNTKAQRTAIDPDEFAWIENIMPVGYANLKTVGNQTQVKDNTGNVVVGLANVTYMNSVTLLGTPYLLGFEVNGQAEYFKIGRAHV